MKKIVLTALATGALLAPAAPAMAAGQSGHGHQPAHAKQAGHAKEPKTGKAKAYGKFCQGQSKKRVAGQKGTPFSQCVNALAKADRNERATARQACRALSKKHVKGEKGTPFSRCVVGVAQMRKAE